MKNDVQTRRPTLKALGSNSIDLALNGDKCPYCGKSAKMLDKHLEKCSERKKNIEVNKKEGCNEKWGMHEDYGKCFILSKHNGLCLIEAESGRYVVPITSLHMGLLGNILDHIEKTDLSIDEIEKIINALRIKSKNEAKVPKYPDLWPGARIEAQFGNSVKAVTIKYKRGDQYIVTEDASETKINIPPNHILRIL